MKNWVKTHKLLAVCILTAFALLVITSLSYVAGGTSGGSGGAVNAVIYTIEKPLSAVSNSVRGAFRGIFGYRNLTEENERLKEENSELRKQLIDESLKRQDLTELRALAESLNYNFASDEQRIVTANVTAADLSDWVDIFTIDRGRNDGIYQNAVVVSEGGLVGSVYEVGDNWAKVVSILDDAEHISFRIFRQPEYIGIMEGDGSGSLRGYMLDSDASVIEGDLLITSNMGIYPEGISIGSVKSTEYDEDAQLIRLEIEPSADINRLRKVSLIL